MRRRGYWRCLLVFFLLRLPRPVGFCPLARAVPSTVRSSGVFCSGVGSAASSSLLSGVEGRRGIGVRGSLLSRLRYPRAVVLLGSWFVALIFPLCVPFPLQHFRPNESQLRHRVHAMAHGHPFMLRDQVDPEEQGQHVSSVVSGAA